MPDTATASRAPGAAAPASGAMSVGRWRSRYVLLLLFGVGVFNIVDRQILAVLLEPIRLEFGVSDAAMGVLTGFAFVLFYSLATLPIARLADARPRRTIMAAGIAFWGAMTAVSGFATSFGQLALARVGVGVGEASYLPAGMSIVSDHFPPERRTLALAVFSLALPIGGMASLALGGSLGTAIGWRMTLFWLGVPGLALALLVRLTMAEPDRGAVEPAADRSLYDVPSTLAYLWSLRSFRHLVAGAALSMCAGMALRIWSPTFLMRVHDMDLAQTGLSLGPAVGVGGIVGVLVGGALTQRLARRDARWLLWAPAAAQLLGLPFVALFLTLPTGRAAVPMFIGVAMFGAATNAPAMTAVQGLAKVRMRALAAALASFAINLAGIGLGPLIAGVLSDALQPAFGDASLRWALLLTGSVAAWAAVHFVLGARSLVGELQRASEALS